MENSTQLPPLSNQDKDKLILFLTRAQNPAVAARDSGTHYADFLEWSSRPEIAAYVEHHRNLLTRVLRDEAFAYLDQLMRSTRDETIRCRAAIGLLRATDPARLARSTRSRPARTKNLAGAAPPTAHQDNGHPLAPAQNTTSSSTSDPRIEPGAAPQPHASHPDRTPPEDTSASNDPHNPPDPDDEPDDTPSGPKHAPDDPPDPPSNPANDAQPLTQPSEDDDFDDDLDDDLDDDWDVEDARNENPEHEVTKDEGPEDQDPEGQHPDDQDPEHPDLNADILDPHPESHNTSSRPAKSGAPEPIPRITPRTSAAQAAA